MVLVRGKRDSSLSPETALGNRDDGLSPDFTQISPSQLPKLLPTIPIEETEGKLNNNNNDNMDNNNHMNMDNDNNLLGITGSVLNNRVVSELQQLLRCPICHLALLNDPAIVDPCGHAFCYNCINMGLEKGCFPVEKMEGKTSCHTHNNNNNNNNNINKDDINNNIYSNTGESKKYRVDKPIEEGRGRQRRRRKIQFTCPVCLGPAHKWNLVRVPLIREVVLEALQYTALANILNEDLNNNNNNNNINKDDGNISYTVKEEMASSCMTTPIQKLTEPPLSQSNGLLITASVDMNKEYTIKDNGNSMHHTLPSSTSPSVINTTVSTSNSLLNNISIPQVISYTIDTRKDLVEDISSCTHKNHLDDDRIKYNKEQEESNRKRSRENVEYFHELMLMTETIDMKDDLTQRVMDENDIEITSGLNEIHSNHSPQQEQQKEEKEEESLIRSFIPIFVLDPSVPNTSNINNIISSAVRLFGAIVMDERNTCENNLWSTSQELFQPISIFIHSIPSHSITALTSSYSNSLHWKEVQYNAEPLIGTHCLVGISSSRHSSYSTTNTINTTSNTINNTINSSNEEILVSTMTPSIASALVSTPLVLNMEWLKECVKTQQLESTLPYKINGSLYARWNEIQREPHVRNCKAGEWMKNGYGFILLPDVLLHSLLSNGIDTSNQSINISNITETKKEIMCGGYSLLAWKRLILIGGGVLLQLADGCLDALVRYILSCEIETSASRLACATSSIYIDSEEKVIDGDVWKAVKDVLKDNPCLWKAHICTDRQTTTTNTNTNTTNSINSDNTNSNNNNSNNNIQCVMVMHGPIPSALRSIELQQRLTRLTRAIQVLFTLPSTLLNQEETFSNTSTRNVSGLSSSFISNVKPQESCVQLFNDMNLNHISHVVQIRSTTWLLRNLAERRPNAGAPQRWYYNNNNNSSSSSSSSSSGNSTNSNSTGNNSSNMEEDGTLSRKLLYEDKL